MKNESIVFNNIFCFERGSFNEKLEYLRNYKCPNDIRLFLNNKFINLEIQICDKYYGNLMDLMDNNLLEGWCWQTTETAILFFDDSSYIERGVLTLSKIKKYLHSWIVFQYDNKLYIFDPCLSIISKKDIYYNVFDVDLRGKVSAFDVKRYIKGYINGSEEVIINGKRDINYPIYGNNDVGYKIEIDNDNTKKLVAHYHLNR